MNVKIVVVTAKGKFEHELNKNYISIGRSKDNDLIIDDLSVSRKHAILEQDETGKFFITDLNSSNGTFVNNVRIKEKTPITLKDHILLGKATIVIEAPEEFQGTMRIDTSKLQEKIKEEASTQMGGNIPVPPPVEDSTIPPTQELPPQPQAPVPPPVQSQPAPHPVAHQPEPEERPYRGNIVYGSILQRFLALLIDGFILGISLSIVITILSFIFFKIFPYGLATGLTMLVNILAIGAGVAYYVIGYSKYGTTIGKKIFKLYVVDQKKLTKPTTSQALIRTLVQFFISGIFFIGYIMAFFNPEHTTLHDMLAKTYVIKK